MEKQKLLRRILEAVDKLPNSAWGNCSDNWGTATMITALTLYNVTDVLNIYMDKYELFSFICKNQKRLSSSEHWGTGSPYDCTGKCIGQATEFRRSGEFILVIKSASYDI